MAPALGKRKRVTRAELEQPSRSPSPSSGSGDDSEKEDLQAIFRRAFEAKFKPLPTEPKKPKIEETPVQKDEPEEEESDWSGISDDENQVEVIEYHDPRREVDDAGNERAEMKAFMSSKPPTSASSNNAPASQKKKKKEDADDDTTEASNLKNDLALQKLLRESHLLSASSSGTSTPSTLTATGVDRHKSIDLHLQSLGAKGSIFKQKKMPMAQRKHMELKARTTEERRRSEAREAGIVLERENKAATGKKVERKRERGVGGPSIGKFRGGTLSLSKKDVMSITGGGGSKGKGKGKKGKR
ncbi:hypothetical protein yc1106_05826 [Curvularia clavata]|uniref:Uncharacterized protein n=1 Tax=Curvularia clavata TaxID=95742 RepID=A0A9Q8Z8S3_CURCL|nr:hypothetical protein yc1106_05826 [Curvularia clavata]